MEIEFRVDDIPNCMELFKKLRSKAYRILICKETKDKNGNPTKTHYYGYAEWDGKIKNPTDAVRNIIKKYCSKASEYMVRLMKNTTLKALAYCYKQQEIVVEYNICVDYDDLIAEWIKMQEEWQNRKNAEASYKDQISEYVRTNCESNYQSVDEIKLMVCKKMVADKKLPSMGKVRSYTLYAILDNNLKYSEIDLYKLC